MINEVSADLLLKANNENVSPSMVAVTDPNVVSPNITGVLAEFDSQTVPPTLHVTMPAFGFELLVGVVSSFFLQAPNVNVNDTNKIPE